MAKKLTHKQKKTESLRQLKRLLKERIEPMLSESIETALNSPNLPKEWLLMDNQTLCKFVLNQFCEKKLFEPKTANEKTQYMEINNEKTKSRSETVYEKIMLKLENHDFDVTFDHLDECVSINENISNYDVRFILHYDKNISNYRSADYESPEEGDYKYAVTKVDDLEICFLDELIELEENHEESLCRWLLTYISHKI